jgi:5-methylcytosine-specific restriction endonuclease McrA
MNGINDIQTARGNTAQNQQKFPQSPHAVFMRRTLSIYKNMVARYAERKDKNGRITKYARQIPFTLDVFREWVLQQFGSESKPTRCPYCGAWIDISNFVVDHRIPVSSGGSLALANLSAVDGRCNDIKGRMTGAEYMALLKGLETFSQTGRTDVLHRLEVYVKQSALNQRNRRKGEQQCHNSNSLPEAVANSN